MKKIGLGKRVLACVASAATLLTGTTALCSGNAGADADRIGCIL